MAKQKRLRETNPDAPIWADRINKLLSNESYGNYVATVLEKRPAHIPGNVPERSQAELAAYVGVSESTVSGWVSGKVRNGRKEWPIPNGRDLAKIAQFFGVTTDYLLGLTDMWGSYYDMPHRSMICSYLGLSRAAIDSIEVLAGLRKFGGGQSESSPYEYSTGRQRPIDTLDSLLCDHDFVMLIHEYITSDVVCEAQDFALNDTDADSALLHIISELMWMRRRYIKTRPIPPIEA